MIQIWGKQSDFIVLMLLMTLFVCSLAGAVFAFLTCFLPPTKPASENPINAKDNSTGKEETEIKKGNEVIV